MKTKKKPSIKYLRNKADRLMQEWGRATYKKCLVCGKEMSCLHHYVPKSRSSALRYDKLNLIPVCNSCHFLHHKGDPEIQNEINKKIGDTRISLIKTIRQKIVKTDTNFYENAIKTFTIK